MECGRGALLPLPACAPRGFGPGGHHPGDLCALLALGTHLGCPVRGHDEPCAGLASPGHAVLLHHSPCIMHKHTPALLPSSLLPPNAAPNPSAPFQPKLSFHSVVIHVPQWHWRAVPAFCAQADALLAVTEAGTAPCAWQWL